MRHYDRDVLDEAGLLRDGQSIHFPLIAMDSAHRTALDVLHRERGVVFDGSLHRPGYRFARDQAARDAEGVRDAAYVTYCYQASEAWRGGRS